MSLTCTVIVSAVADKAKRFLAEFYNEGDEGKIFKYGEQLVSSIKISTSSLLMFALVIQIDYQLEPLTSNLKFNSILQCCKIVCIFIVCMFINCIFFDVADQVSTSRTGGTSD